MNDESLLKRTLLFTGKLVGIFSLWVTVVTLVAVGVAGRMASALSGASGDKGALAPADSIKKDEGAALRGKNPPATATNKPNG
jgi:hypothetical protein